MKTLKGLLILLAVVFAVTIVSSFMAQAQEIQLDEKEKESQMERPRRSSGRRNFFDQLDQAIKASQEQKRTEKKDKEMELLYEQDKKEREELERYTIKQQKMEQERIEQAKIDLKIASISDLVKKLRDKSKLPGRIPDEKYSGLVLDELESRGPVAIPALVSLMDYSGPITEILKRIQSKYGVQGMAPALKDQNVAVRLYALETLGTMGPEAIPILTQATRDENSAVRLKHIEVLGKLEAKEATAVIIDATKDTDRNVRLCAIDTLRKIGTKEVVIPVLVIALKDEEPDIQIKAIEALGEIGAGAKPAVPILIQMLKNKDNSIVVNSIGTLGKIGKDARPAVPVLIQIASKGETKAYDALEEIGTPEAKAAVERHRQHERAVEQARIAKEAAAAKARRAKFIAILREKGNLSGLEVIRRWVAKTENTAALMTLSEMLNAGTYMNFLYARENPEAVFKVIEGFSRQGDMGVLILHSQTGLPATVIKEIFDAWGSVY